MNLRETFRDKAFSGAHRGRPQLKDVSITLCRRNRLQRSERRPEAAAGQNGKGRILKEKV